MTLLTTLAHLHAARTGRAEPLSRVRHYRLADRPLVVLPLNFAGEAAAPLAAMVGTDRRDPMLLTVPQPRNRDLRFGFFTELARVLSDYIETCKADRTEVVGTDEDGTERTVFGAAPQVIVPGRAALAYLGLLGRSTRFRRPDGPNPVDPSVPLIGTWLTFLTERAEHPGSAMLMALTDLLAMHWATGQSPLEDANLAAQLGWIDPPDGMTGQQAALVAEDPLQCPPAGPATDPDFDKEVLGPAIERYDRAVADGNPEAVRRAAAVLRDELASQLQPTWRLMWRGIALLRALPGGEAPSAEVRWREDRREFTGFSDHVDGGGRPQPRHDHAVTAARRLHDLERAQAVYDMRRALEDPFVMAELRTTGDAFGGTVVAREPERTEISERGRRLLRPQFTVRTGDPLRIEAGAQVVRPDRPSAKARVCAVAAAGDADDDAVDADDAVGAVDAVDGAVGPDVRLVVLRVTGGMGTPKKPCAEAVPEVGDAVVFTRDPGWSGRRRFPPLEETPWTHGGPPTGEEATGGEHTGGAWRDAGDQTVEE